MVGCATGQTADIVFKLCAFAISEIWNLGEFLKACQLSRMEAASKIEPGIRDVCYHDNAYNSKL